jgi:hypothetical protein
MNVRRETTLPFVMTILLDRERCAARLQAFGGATVTERSGHGKLPTTTLLRPTPHRRRRTVPAPGSASQGSIGSLTRV